MRWLGKGKEHGMRWFGEGKEDGMRCFEEGEGGWDEVLWGRGRRMG